jgi:hypothetical protein
VVYIPARYLGMVFLPLSNYQSKARVISKLDNKRQATRNQEQISFCPSLQKKNLCVLCFPFAMAPDCFWSGVVNYFNVPTCNDILAGHTRSRADCFGKKRLAMTSKWSNPPSHPNMVLNLIKILCEPLCTLFYPLWLIFNYLWFTPTPGSSGSARPNRRRALCG